MKNRWILLIILTLGLAACALRPAGDTSPTEAFELYLLADDQAHGADIIDIPIDALELAESPLLTTSDLISYDRSTHAIELTDGGFQKVTTLLESGVQVAGIPFVIISGGERLYAGAFWTPLSSQSYDGVVIIDPAFLSESNTIQITLGYPGVDFYSGADPRDNVRLMRALDAAGVLK